MYQIRYAVLAALLSPLALTAQTKNFTMAEATNGLSTTLALKGLRQTSWQPGTHYFFQVANNSWVRTDAGLSQTDTLFSLKSLNNSVFGKDSLKTMPSIGWLGQTTIYFRNNNTIYLSDAGNSKGPWRRIALPESADHITVEEQTGTVAYTLDNNLWLQYKGQTLQVSDDKDLNILNGTSVHRDEFGIDKGIFFSPKGNLLAYYRMDQTMVNDYPVIDWSVTPAKARNIKYPMAGGTSHEVSLIVYNPATGESTRIKTGTPKDKYLTCVTWSPDEKYIYIATLNREQDHLRLNQYDAVSGEKINTLFEETDAKYVQPQNPLHFISGDQFIWWSQRDGFMHLYLYNTSGKLQGRITRGDWMVNELLAYNKATQEVIYTASKASPMEKNTYATPTTALISLMCSVPPMCLRKVCCAVPRPAK
jgi:dipeptidyl-peptidase-4